MPITLQLGKINLSDSATAIEPPKITHETHLEHWDRSGVDCAISRLNVFTLTNLQEITKHLNIGDLSNPGIEKNLNSLASDSLSLALQKPDKLKRSLTKDFPKLGIAKVNVGVEA